MALSQERKFRVFSLKLAKRIVLCLVIVFIFDFFLFPFPVLASEYEEEVEIIEEKPIIINNNLPANNELEIKKEAYYSVTAYTSEVGQCDASPCITANGFNLCEYGIEDSVAANFLPFGAKIRIPEAFGDRVFIVRDRMNARYTDRIDVWMLDKQEAKKFGVKVLKVEILEH